jgi:hypothetical protein
MSERKHALPLFYSMARIRRAMSLWVVAPTGCKGGVKKLTLKAIGEARGKLPRGRGWLRSNMASPYEACFDLREIAPLSRNNLPTHGVAPNGFTGQRAGCLLRSHRDWLHLCTSPKDEASNLNLPCLRSGFRKERLGSVGKRCLRYFVESLCVNVGGFYQDVKMSSPPMTDRSVGAVIVVGGWESQPQGEGRQRVKSC